MHFTSAQIEKFIDDIPEFPIEDIDLSRINLSEVAADKLAKAVSHVYSADVSTHLSTDQCAQILDTSLSSTTLANLDLSYVDLSGVPADLLGTAVSRLKTVRLNQSSLTTNQCVSVLKTSLSSTTLAHLDLSGNDLSGVPSDLFAMAVSRLKTVDLVTTEMTTNQCVNVLKISLSSTTLAHLDLWNNDLSGVPADLLAMAVSRLKTVDLGYTKLMTNQCVQLLNSSLTSATLVDVDLGWNNFRGVPAELLATAVGRLKTVKLSYTQLTTNQCVQLLNTSLASATLVHLVLKGNNLRGIPAELLASAKDYLKITHSDKDLESFPDSDEEYQSMLEEGEENIDKDVEDEECLDEDVEDEECLEVEEDIAGEDGGVEEGEDMEKEECEADE